MVCLPAIVTAACFVAIILLNLYNRDWKRIPGHALLGVFAVLITLFICEKGSDVVAWVLLGTPFLLVFIGYWVSVWFETKAKPVIPVDPVDNQCQECPCCHFQRCRCRRPCWRPRPKCPDCPTCPDCPKPKPKPKPDNCISPSLANE